MTRSVRREVREMLCGCLKFITETDGYSAKAGLRTQYQMSQPDDCGKWIILFFLT
jgi:hypothetical protein